MTDSANRDRRIRALWPAGLLLVMVLAGFSCRPSGPASPKSRSAGLNKDEFSVMTYNLSRYGLADRDEDGQKIEPKPAAEREAIVGIIADANPDVLAVEEIGNPTVFEEFRFALQQAGLVYPHVEYLQRGQSENNLAVLSRFPIVSRQPHTDDTYSIGAAQVPVLRGFIDIDIEVNPSYSFRLLTAHLKSKVFHVLGQTEMRRNEARLLNKYVRKALKDNPDANILVVGDLNDSPNSAALREVKGAEQSLFDLRPEDDVGDVWTHCSADQDQYTRIDYILASRGMMPEIVREKTRVVRDSRMHLASDHRPVLAIVKSVDMPINETPVDTPPRATPAAAHTDD